MASALLTSHPLILPPSFNLTGDRTSPFPVTIRSQPLRINSANASAEKTRSFNTNTINYSSNAKVSSLYQILQVPMEATAPEIKSAYRRLARTCHPDVTSRENTSADEFMKIRDAYSTLSDPVKRAEYDRKMFRLRRSRIINREPVFARSGGGYSGRNWESDQCW